MFHIQLWSIMITLLFTQIGFAATKLPNTKIALVIGNSNYEILPELRNATHDASAIARVLSGLGFTVFLTRNTTYEDLKRTLSFFTSQASEANQIVIYFAGHGRSDEGIASLLPVDAKQSHINGITTTYLLEQLNNPFAQKAIIFDACLEVVPNRYDTKNHNIYMPANLPPETALIFATSYGKAAYDGKGSHSLFAGAFLDRLITHQTDLVRTIQSVRADVIQSSRSQQMPITVSTLTLPFDLSIDTAPNKYDPLTHKVLRSYSSTGFSDKPLLGNLAKESIK